MVDEPGPEPTPKIRYDKPSSARVWNYWMGGKDNYEVDRRAGDAVIEVNPDIRTLARQWRQFLIRAVRYLAGEAGIRQFLDIGTGLPTMQNTHEVAQAVAPESKIVYVDNDRFKSGCPHAPSLGVWQIGDRPRRRAVTGQRQVLKCTDSSALTS